MYVVLYCVFITTVLLNFVLLPRPFVCLPVLQQDFMHPDTTVTLQINLRFCTMMPQMQLNKKDSVTDSIRFCIRANKSTGMKQQ